MSSVGTFSSGINYLNHDFVSVDLHPKNNKNLKKLGNGTNRNDLCAIWNNYYFENPGECLTEQSPNTITLEQNSVYTSNNSNMNYYEEQIHHGNASLSSSLVSQHQQQEYPQDGNISNNQMNQNVVQPPIQQQPLVQQQQRQTKQRVKLIAPRNRRSNNQGNTNVTPQRIKADQINNIVPQATYQFQQQFHNSNSQFVNQPGGMYQNPQQQQQYYPPPPPSYIK